MFSSIKKLPKCGYIKISSNKQWFHDNIYIDMYQFNYSFMMSLTHACIGIIHIT